MSTTNALAVYRVDDGRIWTETKGAEVQYGESLPEAALRLFEENAPSIGFLGARLISVEVIYKGRRGKAGD